MLGIPFSVCQLIGLMQDNLLSSRLLVFGPTLEEPKNDMQIKSSLKTTPYRLGLFH
jgi:hypothetical protein